MATDETSETSEIIDRALEALKAPELRKADSSRTIGELLVSARKSGTLPSARLHSAVKDLMAETGADKQLARRRDEKTDDSDSAEFSGLFGLLILLILLLLLMARIDRDSDVTALLDDLIQQILDLLKGG